MLLRIPENAPHVNSATNALVSTTAAARVSAPSSAPIAADSGRAYGTITRSVYYTVQQGDSLASIAAHYTQNGNQVTSDEIRLRNQLAAEPPVGMTLAIPLKTVYGSTSQSPSNDTGSRAATAMSSNGVQVSEEVDIPVAQSVQFNEPVYRGPTSRPEPRKTTRRGPSALSSRSYSPSSDGGARVLGQNEDAFAISSSPQPRPRVFTTNTPRNLARVAQIASNGARIRRLPESEAVTLYRCPVGTELAVTGERAGWASILMSDRSTGWVPSKYLSFTGAQVDVTSQVATASSQEVVTSYNGHYTSTHPVVEAALQWLGTPYVYGGESRRGIDCSSLVQHAFRSCGYQLPRTAAEQAHIGKAVAPSDLQPGDRLYFSASGTRIDHTGLYMGNGLFVHASGRGRRVMVSNLFEPHNWNIFVCARR
jgi:cell wall-associated NlpC family hydrolase